MKPDQTALERAFELSTAGRCRSVEDIQQCLNREGYDAHQINGPILRKQLLANIVDAQSACTRTRAKR